MASEEVIRWIREHLTVIRLTVQREDLTGDEKSARVAREVAAIVHLVNHLNVTVVCPMKSECPMVMALVAQDTREARESMQSVGALPLPMENPKRFHRGD